MRLAFIHGINNEDNTAESIAEDWWNSLEYGWQNSGLEIPEKPEISVGYYADVLADALNGQKPGAVAQGGSETSRSSALEFIRAYQDAAGISDEEVDAELAQMGKQKDIVDQGRAMEFFVDVAEALERILPGHGKFIADRFLRQAGLYIEDEGLAEQIDEIVKHAVFGDNKDPVVVVSHSLGTVVAYRVTMQPENQTRTIPLFATLGSPLGIGMMQRVIHRRIAFPEPPISTWTNGLREDDFVTLGRNLDKSNLGFDGINNISNNLIERSDKHSVNAYLESKPICSAIHAALIKPQASI